MEVKEAQALAAKPRQYNVLSDSNDDDEDGVSEHGGSESDGGVELATRKFLQRLHGDDDGSAESSGSGVDFEELDESEEEVYANVPAKADMRADSMLKR